MFFSRHNYGGSLIPTIFLSLMVGIVGYAVNDKILKNFAISQKLTVDSQASVNLSSYVAMTETLLAPGASDCGQYQSSCPGVFPSPLQCGSDTNFKIFVPGKGWELLGSKVSGFVAPSQTAALADMVDKKETILKIQGKKSAGSGFGRIKYKVPRLGPIKSEDIMNQTGWKEKHLEKGATVYAEIEGVECNETYDVKVDAVFLRLAYHDEFDNETKVKRARLPVSYPTPSCILSTGTNSVAKDQTSIDVAMIANGAWKRAYPPAGSSNSNNDPLEVDAAHLVYDGPVTWTRDKCDLYTTIDASVSAYNNQRSYCYLYLYYEDINTVLDLPDDCPAKISYIKAVEDAKKKGEDPPPPPPPIKVDEDAELEEKECPDSYYTWRDGKRVFKTYIVNDKMECVAVYAKDTDL